MINQYRLKSLEEISKESDLRYDDITNHYISESNGWLINTVMKQKFGDGRYYTFDLNNVHVQSKYTHRCKDDGCFYHQSWFFNEEELKRKKDIFFFDPEELLF